MKDRDWFLRIASGLVVLGWLGWLVWTCSNLDKFDPGTFGDSFGALNALFSGLAFAILIATIRLQKAELQLQREEMALQREEMSQSRSELAGQKEQLSRQNELTILSARLSVLPSLIAQQHTAIVQADDNYKGWVLSSPSGTSAREAVKRCEVSLENLEVKRAALQLRLDSMPESSRDYWVQRDLESVQKDSYRNARLIDHLSKLAEYLDDMDAIYEKLRE